MALMEPESARQRTRWAHGVHRRNRTTAWSSWRHQPKMRVDFHSKRRRRSPGHGIMAAGCNQCCTSVLSVQRRTGDCPPESGRAVPADTRVKLIHTQNQRHDYCCRSVDGASRACKRGENTARQTWIPSFYLTLGDLHTTAMIQPPRPDNFDTVRIRCTSVYCSGKDAALALVGVFPNHHSDLLFSVSTRPQPRKGDVMRFSQAARQC